MRFLPLLLLLCSALIADDSADLQAAIDAGIPIDRSFVLDRQVVLRSGATLAGRGTVSITAAGPIRGEMLLIDGDNITLDGLTIDASKCHTAIRCKGEVSNVRITDCDVIGTVGTTVFLLDVAGPGRGLSVERSKFSGAANHIRARGGVTGIRISFCDFADYRSYALQLRATVDGGPRDIDCHRLTFHNPAPGSAGAARQAIVTYADSDATPGIVGLRLTDIEVTGPGTHWNPKDEFSSGTADQIVLHYCRDFELRRVRSLNGGEIGITICRRSCHGLLEDIEASGNDAHGLQIGSADRLDQFKLDTYDIEVRDSFFSGNGKREDGKPDSMAHVHIQNAYDVRVKDTLFEDRNTPRRVKHAVLTTLSEQVELSDNPVLFVDKKGAAPYGSYSSTVKVRNRK